MNQPHGMDGLETRKKLRGDSPARLRSNGPRSNKSSASVVPSTNSIDTISWPSSTTRSNTRHTFGETT